MLNDDHIGMWSTADGAIRKLLLPNGRFMALTMNAERRYQGEYRIAGSRIEYRQDSGETAVGAFEDGLMIGANGVPLYPEDMLAAMQSAPARQHGGVFALTSA
jgi:hypothetical protein